MNLIDTHAHIFLPEFSDDIDAVIMQSKNAGVKKIFLPNIDSSTIPSLMHVAEKYIDYCYPMIGLHPCSVNQNFEKELEEISSLLDHKPFAGIGEAGTDLYWDKTYFNQQEKALEFQVKLAIQHNLPIVLHSRDSMDETIRIIRNFAGPGLRGIFHCFTGSLGQAKEIIEMNFLIGVGGVLTFKNSKLFEVIKEVDLDKLVLETDSPYLAPAPHRGKRNDPSKIVFVNQKLAEIKNMDPEETCNITTRNALNLFRQKL